MQSLHTRLDPIKEEVLKVWQVEGFLGVYERGWARDEICFEKWRKEVDHNGTGSAHHLFSYGSVQSLLDRAIAAFIETVVDLKAKNAELRRENAYLRAQLRILDHSHADKLLELVTVCQDRGAECAD